MAKMRTLYSTGIKNLDYFELETEIKKCPKCQKEIVCQEHELKWQKMNETGSETG